MKRLFALFVLSIPLSVVADGYPDSLSRLSIETGANFSLFINAEEPGVGEGFSVGLRYDSQISKKLLFSTGIFYSKKGGYIDHLYAAAGYFEFLFLYGYPLYIRKNKEISAYGGLSFLLPVKDYTKNDYNRIYSSQNINENKYICDDESAGCPEYGPFNIGNNRNIALEFGCFYKYKQIMFDVNVNYQLLDFGEFGYYHNIDKNLISVQILFGLFFR